MFSGVNVAKKVPALSLLAPGAPFCCFPLASLVKVTDPLDLLSKLQASTPTAVQVTKIQTTKATLAPLQ